MSMNNYNYENGKLKASIKWLITRIYNEHNSLPDNLQELFTHDNEGHLTLTAPVIACLTNASFYCQAASRIFQDASILTNNIGSVFNALTRYGIDVRDSHDVCITEEVLSRQSPFNFRAHLVLIDALMTAQLMISVSIDKVVHAISNYTPIDKREEPLDSLDALLFWINKICLLVRDDVERHGIPLVGGSTTNNDVTAPTIPEMEDLYEDLCDGSCICTLCSFYRPNELSLQEICFADPMSVNDCKFNLELLKKFCSHALPWNPFYFEIDDILYLHESLQPNVNAFLADLFYFFEGQSAIIEDKTPSYPIQRTFIPVRPIPDLRSDTAYSKFMPANPVMPKLTNQYMAEKRDRTLSMASEESMMTGTTLKSRDSLTNNYANPVRLNPNLPITHFAALKIDSSPEMIQQSAVLQNDKRQEEKQQQKNLAEIRLQMEEMRRQLQRIQQLETSKQEQARNEASKDAFFRVMSRSVNNDLTALAGSSSPYVQPQLQQFTPISLSYQPQQQQQQQCNISDVNFAVLNPLLSSTPYAFKLHQTNTPVSRLDPQLELNTGLTNWGITYREDRPQRKTWATKQAENNMNQQSSSSNLQWNTERREDDNIMSPTSNLAANEAYNHQISQTTTGKEQERLLMTKSLANKICDDVDSKKARTGGLRVDDMTVPNAEMTPEMQAKRSALLANQIKRKERILAKNEEREMESIERQLGEVQKMDAAEQRKLEREQRRQKLLEDYKRKKMEQELANNPLSERMCTSSTLSLNRGQSQPPFGRLKSQSNMNLHQTREQNRPGRFRTNKTQNANDENTTPRVSMPVIAEPTLKLFAKQQPKSNRSLIVNAIQYSVFPGHVSNESRQKAQAAIAASDAKHFLVLFRDHKCQYRGLYTWDQFSDTVHKIEGLGPKICKEPMMSIMYKYDSGAKSFGQIPTKHLSATIDGFVIADQYWQKPKLPFSGR